MEEKSNVRSILIGLGVVLVSGFVFWAYRSYQKPVRITPKEGHVLADKFGDEKLDSEKVAPLPGATPITPTDGQQAAPGTSSATSRPALTKEQFEASTNAWLTGRVVLKGTPPAERPLELDAECQSDVERLKIPTPMTRDFVTGTNSGLANVIVTVMNPPGDMSGDVLDGVTIHIRGCQIHPYVTAVMSGQQVSIRNHDMDFHEIKGYPTNFPNAVVDFALLPNAPPANVSFTREEDLINLYTDKRRWIKGYLAVATHPYFGVTDSNGWFRIPLPPAGDTQLRALHPLLPPVIETVVLGQKTNAPVQLVLEYQPPKKAAK